MAEGQGCKPEKLSEYHFYFSGPFVVRVLELMLGDSFFSLTLWMYLLEHDKDLTAQQR